MWGLFSKWTSKTSFHYHNFVEKVVTERLCNLGQKCATETSPWLKIDSFHKRNTKRTKAAGFHGKNGAKAIQMSVHHISSLSFFGSFFFRSSPLRTLEIQAVNAENPCQMLQTPGSCFYSIPCPCASCYSWDLFQFSFRYEWRSIVVNGSC